MGLADIRLVVRLMCLCAAHHTPSPASSSPSTPAGGGDGGEGADSSLTYLSAAIGALAQNNPAASRMLVQLCTQVSLVTVILIGPTG